MSAPASEYMARILGLLGEREPLAVLAETPERLAAMRPRLDPERPYGPGKWTARQVLCHLADTELADGFRTRQILAGVGEVQPWDQEAWMERSGGLSLDLAVETFQATRAWNLAMLGRLDEADLERSAHHPERGRVSVRLMVRFRAGHDLNHLAQLETVAGP